MTLKRPVNLQLWPIDPQSYPQMYILIGLGQTVVPPLLKTRPSRPRVRRMVRVSNLCRMTGMNDDLEDKPPPAVGAYWINEEDYPALLKILADGNTLPRTWKEWLKIAEEMEKGLKAYGHVVMRVRIALDVCRHRSAGHYYRHCHH
jgi:hypothetical protein